MPIYPKRSESRGSSHECLPIGLLVAGTLLLCLGTSLDAQATSSCSASAGGREIPAIFVGNRIFVRWHTQTAGDLFLYTDTGGGMVSLYPEAVQRLRAPVDTIRWRRGSESGMRLVVKVPRTLGDSILPLPLDSNPGFARFLVQYEEEPPTDVRGTRWDGRLGSLWFANGVWILDYLNRRLYFNDSVTTGPRPSQCWVPLAFQTDSLGSRTNSFPRVTGRIEGEAIEFLLDTGARTQLTEDASAVVEPSEPRVRATSFIVQERFERWHKRHPDWLLVPNAEDGTGLPMIRVPIVEIGNRRIGPVWFTERPNANFRTFMSQYMDRPVEGALGGSAWRDQMLVLDYPRARMALLVP